VKKSMIHANVLAAIFLLTSPAWAVIPYQPVAPVEIMTAVTAEDASGTQPVFSRFIVGPAQKIAEAFKVGFFTPETGNPIGSLHFLPSGVITWDGKGTTSKRFQADDLLILSGLSVPIDVLPVNRLISNKGEPAVYEFHRVTGDRTFVDRIQISVYSVTIDQARQSQWLRLEKDIPVDLKMVEAVEQQTGLIVVKQLWVPGSDWWLYEETPFRNSWRIK